jgi:branched-chain amino acid aminotransferase
LRETDLSPRQARDADEAFYTSTSLCVCPVASIDGHAYQSGIPGPVTARLMAGFAQRVGMDYVAQYRRFLAAGASGTGL